MTPSPLPIRTAVSVVVLRGDAVLLVRRGRAPAAGRWAPVGGRIEPGETEEEAARREVAEETGVAIDLLGRCGESIVDGLDHDGRPVRWVLAIHAATWRDGTPRAGDDAAEARFVRLDALDGFDLVDGGRAAIAAARRLADGSPPPKAI